MQWPGHVSSICRGLMDFQQEANSSPAAGGVSAWSWPKTVLGRLAGGRRGTCRAEGQRSRKPFAKRKQLPGAEGRKWTVPTVHGRVTLRGRGARPAALNAVTLCCPSTVTEPSYRLCNSRPVLLPLDPRNTLPDYISRSVPKCWQTS